MMHWFWYMLANNISNPEIWISNLPLIARILILAKFLLTGMSEEREELKIILILFVFMLYSSSKREERESRIILSV